MAQNSRLVARIKRMESKVLAKPSYWFPDADGVGSALGTMAASCGAVPSWTMVSFRYKRTL